MHTYRTHTCVSACVFRFFFAEFAVRPLLIIVIIETIIASSHFTLSNAVVIVVFVVVFLPSFNGKLFYHHPLQLTLISIRMQASSILSQGSVFLPDSFSTVNIFMHCVRLCETISALLLIQLVINFDANTAAAAAAAATSAGDGAIATATIIVVFVPESFRMLFERMSVNHNATTYYVLWLSVL